MGWLGRPVSARWVGRVRFLCTIILEGEKGREGKHKGSTPMVRSDQRVVSPGGCACPGSRSPRGEPYHRVPPVREGEGEGGGEGEGEDKGEGESEGEGEGEGEM